MALRLSATDSQYVQWSAAAYVAGSRVDTTDMEIEAAFVTPGTEVPEEADWVTASWDSDGVGEILIGPNGHELSVGNYDMWSRVTDDPEQVSGRLGALVIE